MGNPALMTPHFQFPLPTPPPQDTKAKTSKGVKGYPNGWQRVLNRAKDTICSSILLQEPFLGSTRARVVATECFHEAMRIEIGNGTVLEPGVFHLIIIPNISDPAEERCAANQLLSIRSQANWFVSAFVQELLGEADENE